MTVSEAVFKHFAYIQSGKGHSYKDRTARHNSRINDLIRKEIERYERISDRPVMRRKMYKLARDRISKTAWDRLYPKPTSPPHQDTRQLPLQDVQRNVAKQRSEDSGGFFDQYDGKSDHEEEWVTDYFKAVYPSPDEEERQVEHNWWTTVASIFKNPLVVKAIRRRKEMDGPEMEEPNEQPQKTIPQQTKKQDSERLLGSPSEVNEAHLIGPRLAEWRLMQQKKKIDIGRLSVPYKRQVRTDDVYLPSLADEPRPKSTPVRVICPEIPTFTTKSDLKDSSLLDLTFSPKNKRRKGHSRRIYQDRQHEFDPDRKFFNQFLKTEVMETRAASNTRRLAKQGAEFLLGRKSRRSSYTAPPQFRVRINSLK